MYHIYCSEFGLESDWSKFTKKLVKLHADTFNTDPTAVRVMFKSSLGEVHSFVCLQSALLYGWY
jgi:hypothetical protein